MQKFFLLFSATFILCFSVNAQRYIDIGAEVVHPSTNETFYAGDTLSMWFRIRNFGTDTITGSDSIALELKIDNTVTYFPPNANLYKTIAGNICYPTGSILESIKAIVDTTWVVGKMDICMRVWFLNTVDVIMDTLIANDTSCSTINIDKKTVDVNKVAGAVGNISVYPNPVSKALHVKLPADILPEEAMVRFYDVFGRLLYSGVAENKVMTIDISTFPSGSYFLNVIGGDGRKYVTKILKE